MELIRSNLNASSSSSSSLNPSNATSTATSAYTSNFNSANNSVNITRASSPRALRMPKKYPKSPILGSNPVKDPIYISPRGECETKNSDPRSFEGFGRALIPIRNDNQIFKREKPLHSGLECPSQAIPTRLYSDVLDMLNLTSIDSCVDTLISNQSEDSRKHWDDLQRKKDKISDLAQKKGRKVEHRVATRLSNLRKELSLNITNIPQTMGDQPPSSYGSASFRLPYMESLAVAAVDSPRIPSAPAISPRIPGPGSTFETPSPGLRSTIPSPALPSPRDSVLALPLSLPLPLSSENKIDPLMKKRPSWHVEDLPPDGHSPCLFIPVESPKSGDSIDNGHNHGLSLDWSSVGGEGTIYLKTNSTDTLSDHNESLLSTVSNTNPTSTSNTISTHHHAVKRRKMNESVVVYPFFGQHLPGTPKVVALRVLEFLEGRDLYSTSCLSLLWSKTATDDSMWE